MHHTTEVLLLAPHIGGEAANDSNILVTSAKRRDSTAQEQARRYSLLANRRRVGGTLILTQRHATHSKLA